MSIPLHLVNGFLGSGKTTFLLHYLHTFGCERRIGVVQNEFSPAGIDGKLIAKQGNAYKILEINNGSVFCVCLLGGFMASLSSFVEDYAPDEIIMEASGMSDPVSIGQIFQSPQLRSKVYLGYSWTIVDAQNFHKVKAIRSRLEHQIRIADTVIVNKCDLAGKDADSLTETIKKINPFATIEQTSFALANLNRQKKPYSFFPVEESTDSLGSDLRSVIIKSNRVITIGELHEFIASVKGDFIRFKGFANTAGNQKVIVQGVVEDFTVTPIEWFAGPTELVGIGHFNEHKDYTSDFESFCI